MMQFRSCLPQVLAVSAKNLLLLSYGMTIGFPTILIPQVDATRGNLTLLQEAGEITLSKEQISWIGSINLLTVPLGCLLSGKLTQPLGRKTSMILLNFPLLLAWVTYRTASSVLSLYVALCITGLSGGLLEAPVLTYVAEITEPRLRGPLSATSSMCVILGVFIQFLLGSVYPWRTVALINLSTPILAILGISFVPESPHWLIVKGRIDDARRSLCWLRGWVEEKEVAVELGALRDSLAVRESPSHSWTPYFRRTFIHPFLLIAYLFLIGHFGGMTSVQTYAVGIFKELKSPLDEYTSTVALGLVQLVGSLCCVSLVRFTGRRKLALSTTLLSGLFFLGVAGYSHFQLRSYSHAPLLGICAAAFFSHTAIRLLPWMLIGEVYPAETRATASGLSSGMGYLLGFAATKSYLHLYSLLGLPGTLALYGSIGILGALGMWVLLPETEGKSLAEVGRYFCGKDNPTFTNTESKL